MELAGSEKKIQTLFHELKREEERSAPTFVRMWNSAAAWKTKPPPNRVSFAVASALLIITLGSLAFWVHNSRRPQPVNQNLAVQSLPVEVTKQSVTADPKLLARDDFSRQPRFNRAARRLAAHRRAELARDAVIRKSVAISRWQSPTVVLMQSPADDVLNAAPALNRSVTELKSFLPNTEVREKK